MLNEACCDTVAERMEHDGRALSQGAKTKSMGRFSVRVYLVAFRAARLAPIGV